MTTYEITYLPAEWMDECIPDTLRQPSDFLHKCEDGSFIVIPKNGKDDLAPERGIEEQEDLLIKVNIGDIVHFQPTEMYGWFTLHVSDDGSFWIDGDYPSKANCFYESHSEDVMDNLNQLVASCGEDGGQMSAGSYRVLVYWWGDDIAYQLDITSDGTPHFLVVGAVQ